ncbi:pentatricopeptide repeat-containing protein At1g04840 [Apium graveolens]|uniref:pentatricopeptide repeat-containing protein At1g04840 n=1 Tax=Apium graveolens TaxID=4045 RepID=UPI003D7976EE
MKLVCAGANYLSKRKQHFPAKTSSLNESTNVYITPLETHFVSLIHACKNTHQLKPLHAHIIRLHLSSNSWVVTQLISFCSLNNSISYAFSIFNHFSNPNLFVYNSIIRALEQNFMFEGCVSCFVGMLRRNVRPNNLTYPSVLKSIAEKGEMGVAKMVHCDVVKRGVEIEGFVRVSLIDMYVKVDLLGYALQVFDELCERDNVLVWNVLINGCCKVGDLGKAVELFEAMPERKVGSWNCLINGFMVKGEVDVAEYYFYNMPERNVVTWTTMVSGFLREGQFKKALAMFSRMLVEGVMPNELTIVLALSACSKAGALDNGVRIHSYAWTSGFRMAIDVGNALIDMYAKCGLIESAKQVFSMTKNKDLRTWTAMIWGWAIHGCFEQALRYFDEMKLSGLKPDKVVFLAVLTACSHAGQVEWGLYYFDSLVFEYSIIPTIKHYAVVVDLFGRAGRLDEALSFIENMPLEPDLVMWGALFSACRAHKNIEMAEYVCQHILQLEDKHPGSFVFLSNVYAGVGRWEDVERVRSEMKFTGADKEPGWSYIELGGQVHSFVAGDRTHALTEELYMKLEDITFSAREQGYMPETEWILHNIEEEDKEESLGRHSEKLALAFALISTTPGATIRIVKNLRVCGDCHSMMKYVSKMCQREILLRDIKRFHHFKDGICSCRDYW